MPKRSILVDEYQEGKKRMKKAISMLLIAVMLLASTGFVFADDTADSSTTPGGIPAELIGLDDYMSINFNGTIARGESYGTMLSACLGGITPKEYFEGLNW